MACVPSKENGKEGRAVRFGRDGDLESGPGAVVPAFASNGGACHVHHVQGKGVADGAEGGRYGETDGVVQGQFAGDGRVALAGTVPKLYSHEPGSCFISTHVGGGDAKAGLPVAASRNTEDHPQVDGRAGVNASVDKLQIVLVIFQIRGRSRGIQGCRVDHLVDSIAADNA